MNEYYNGRKNKKPLAVAKGFFETNPLTILTLHKRNPQDVGYNGDSLLSTLRIERYKYKKQ